MNLPQLCETDIAISVGLITKNEYFSALKAMNSNKSPGNHELMKEFYVAFFNALGNYSVEAINFSFQEGELSTSQKEAAITLAEKKDRDKRLLKNWRAISLINVDDKIISKGLALRVKKVLHTIVHTDSDQTAYIKKRYIG